MPPQLVIDGYLAVAFGLHNYILISIFYDESHSGLVYKILSTKNFENIEPANIGDCLTTAKLENSKIQENKKSRQWINELNFLIGTGSH
jgi:hypothetical protein